MTERAMSDYNHYQSREHLDEVALHGGGYDDAYAARVFPRTRRAPDDSWINAGNVRGNISSKVRAGFIPRALDVVDGPVSEMIDAMHTAAVRLMEAGSTAVAAQDAVLKDYAVRLNALTPPGSMLAPQLTAEFVAAHTARVQAGEIA